MNKIYSLISFILFLFCFNVSFAQDIITGAERVDEYLYCLEGKKVGIVANQTSVIGNTHLVDSLISLGVNIRAIYCPEHGFRGEAEAGAKINSSIDEKTNLPIISLYGNNKKPKKEEFQQNEIIVFDLQDVGTRFYTYISTLHYVMEACAENNIPLIVLDRPNPNAFYIDGPVLKDTTLVSFVGMHPVPIVYGMTIGEYASMINGEGWLGTSSKRVIGETGSLICNLMVIPLENYTHKTHYSLPIAPSPNLKTDNAIALYPSICWFEGTPVSVGRGTQTPFEIIGFPNYVSNCKKQKIISFTPVAIKGVSDNPPYKNEQCRGINLQSNNKEGINLSYLKEMYDTYPNKDNFFQPFFDKLAGTRELKNQIKQNLNSKDIKHSWKKDLEEFKEIREKYLIYK